MRRAGVWRSASSEKAGQPLLVWRVDLQEILSAVTLGKIDHQFENEHIGSIHNVPRATIAQADDHFFKHAQVQQHRLSSTDF